MARTVPARSSLRRAFACSIALHVLALPLLLLLLATPPARDVVRVTSERYAVAARLSIEHRVATGAPARAEVAAASAVPRVAAVRARPAIVPPVAAQPSQRTAPGAPAPLLALRVPALSTSAHRAPHAPAPEIRAAGARASVADGAASHAAGSAAPAVEVAAAPVSADAAAGAALAAAATPAAQPAASAAPIVEAAVQPARDPAPRLAGAAPIGGWGQSFEKPMVADDDALADLRKRYPAAGAIGVSVDESGRATHVSIPASVPADERDSIERDLLALRYVPAECNGLRCSGTVEITL